MFLVRWWRKEEEEEKEEEKKKYSEGRGRWIPAFAGMTGRGKDGFQHILQIIQNMLSQE